MQRVDIKIGFGCNNHCKFCVQGDKRNFCIAKDKKEIIDSLKEAYSKGKRQAIFTGGEPSLHPNFLEIIKIAREMGYELIQIQTNGRIFVYKDFCIKTIRAGANQFAPALHGHNAKIHDFLTSSPGSFAQTVQGIKNLKSLNQFVTTNTVVTTKNYRFLPQIAQLLVNLDVDRFQFAFVHIHGTAKENQSWIVPKKSKVMPYIKKGLDIGINADKWVTTEAIPYCLMQGYEGHISEIDIPKPMTFDAGFKVEDYASYRKNEAKSKGPNCLKCKYNKICEGPWKEYPEIFGWDEFRPILK